MSRTSTRPEVLTPSLEEERLIQALVNRGLISREEADKCRHADNTPIGPESLLLRLADANFITNGQHHRLIQELTLLVGQQIPGYQLLEKLGQGSMGIVFKARQLSMNRLVAIKVLQPRLATNPKDLERFVREAHLVAKLSHNNIVQAFDAGSTGKVYYFVMEYIEGTTIDQELRGGKIYQEREALEIILQIAQALEHAHRRGLIHRDVKPANIVLTTENVAKLADLGLARMQTGDTLAHEEKDVVVGTPFYIAPEQIHGGLDIDGRADIYSLGATLYHMVTGQPPFPGTQVNAVLEAHLNQELTPPDHINTKLSAGLGEMVEFMMAKDRERRYASPRELILDLESLVAGEPPQLARERIKSTVLQELEEGDAEDEEDDDDAVTKLDRGRGDAVPIVWVWILGAFLAVSLVMNLILLISKR